MEKRLPGKARGVTLILGIGVEMGFNIFGVGVKVEGGVKLEAGVTFGAGAKTGTGLKMGVTDLGVKLGVRVGVKLGVNGGVPKLGVSGGVNGGVNVLNGATRGVKFGVKVGVKRGVACARISSWSSSCAMNSSLVPRTSSNILFWCANSDSDHACASSTTRSFSVRKRDSSVRVWSWVWRAWMVWRCSWS